MFRTRPCMFTGASTILPAEQFLAVRGVAHAASLPIALSDFGAQSHCPPYSPKHAADDGFN